MFTINAFIFILEIVIFIKAKTYIIIDEKFDEFNIAGNVDIYDSSNFKIIPANDTHTFVNGTFKYLVEITSPWAIYVHMEHYVRGEWLLQAFTKNFSDFCPEMKNPLQPWYYVTKDLRGCSIPAGHVYNLNMISIELPEFVLRAIPRHYEGRWRTVVTRQITVNGTNLINCARFYADLYIE